MASLEYQVNSESSEDAADDTALLLPFSTIDLDDYISVFGLTKWDDADPSLFVDRYCCKSRFMDYTPFEVK
jgi:hypothetical protein